MFRKMATTHTVTHQDILYKVSAFGQTAPLLYLQRTVHGSIGLRSAQKVVMEEQLSSDIDTSQRRRVLSR